MVDTPPGSATPTDAVERLSPGETVIEPQIDSDRFGRYIWWPIPDDAAAAVLDASGSEPGRLHIGRPPGGPYVPAGLAGLGYRSPGYLPPTEVRP